MVAEDLAVNTRGSSKNRRLMAFHQQGQSLGIDAFGGDQRGGPDGPGIHQPGAKRVGPVEGARVHQAVVLAQLIPAVVHHAARPDGAMRMHHRARIARGARGIDQIGKAIRIPHGPINGRQIAHRLQRIGGDHRQIGRCRGNRRVVQDTGGGEPGDHLLDLARGQLRRSRHRHQSGGDGTQVGNREINGISQPHQDLVARFEPSLQKARSGSPHRLLQTGIGPAFGTGKPDHRKRHLVGQPIGVGQHIGGEVEGGRAWGKGPVVKDRLHGSCVCPGGHLRKSLFRGRIGPVT